VRDEFAVWCERARSQTRRGRLEDAAAAYRAAPELRKITRL
jgi:hypothetical protein